MMINIYGNKTMKKSSIVTLIVLIILIQIPLGIKQVEASSCNVSIYNVDPPNDTIIDDSEVRYDGSILVNITLSWSVSIPFDNIAGYDNGFMVFLDKAYWDETKNDWKYLATNIVTGGKTNILNVPRTITLGLDPTKTWLLNASMRVEYFENGYEFSDINYCYDYDELILEYHIRSELDKLESSFTINPETPITDDNIIFMSTSTSQNSDIVENKWYLDGQYLGHIGNAESWSSSLSKGVHTVELIVTDNFGCTDTETKTFSVGTNQNLTIDMVSIVVIIAFTILVLILGVLIIRRYSKKGSILPPPPLPPPPP